MPDVITNIARLAFEAHKRAEIDKDLLVTILQECVNARALKNGYADEHGLPFPNECEDDEQPIPDEPTHPAMVCSYDEDDTGAEGIVPEHADHADGPCGTMIGAGACGCLATSIGGGS